MDTKYYFIQRKNMWDRSQDAHLATVTQTNLMGPVPHRGDAVILNGNWCRVVDVAYTFGGNENSVQIWVTRHPQDFAPGGRP